LPGSADEHRGDGGLETEVVIADHELHPGETPGPESLQERGPERPVLAVADGHAQDLTVTSASHASGDHHRPGHDPPIDAALQVGGIGEHVRELDVIERPVPERLEVPVELAADATHL